MKYLYSIIILIILVSCGEEKKNNPNDLLFLDRYIMISNSLYENSGMKTSFQAKKAAEDCKDITELAEAKVLFGKIAATKEISEQRKIFENLTHLAEIFASRTKEKYFIQHCPMAFDNKGADWVSKTKEIKNPYFGPEMPNCGSTKQELN